MKTTRFNVFFAAIVAAFTVQSMAANPADPDLGTRSAPTVEDVTSFVKKITPSGRENGLFNEGALVSHKRLVINHKNKQSLAEIYKQARLGSEDAMNFIGYLYDNGAGGVRKDSAVAAKWFKSAASAGSALALHNLGLLFHHGRGVEKNKSVSLPLFEAAALRNVLESKVVIGIEHERNKNFEGALGMYSSVASDPGNVFATTRYGLMLMKGIGTTRNYAKAAAYLEMAAEAWDGDAQWAMAEINLITSEGRVPNVSQAAMWYFIAQSNSGATRYHSIKPQILGMEVTSEKTLEYAKATADTWIASHAMAARPKDYTKTMFDAQAQVFPLFVAIN